MAKPCTITGMIDLHTHSKASDGSFSPAELIALAAKQGLSALALTDHDTVGGLAEAAEAAKNLNLRFIPGIELEISVPPVSGEFHLLGLGINRPSPAFLKAVTELSQRREERNREILRRMESLNLKGNYSDLEALSGGHSIGRPHFARLLIKQKAVKNVEQAFSRYLGKGRPLYVPKTGLDFDSAVSIIKESGGLAVLAHPMSLYASWGRLPALIQTLRNRGLDGIEAWHPAAKVRDCKRLEELGRLMGLFITAGSDFHGETRPDRKLGISAGKKKIEYTLLDNIPLG